jgi:hypothetical protein
MSYTTQEGRTQILDDAASAAQRLGVALSELGEAYEHLDEQTADRMEAQVFRPLQGAYGHLKRTLTEFADRVGLPGSSFPVAAEPAPENPRVASCAPVCRRRALRSLRCRQRATSSCVSSVADQSSTAVETGSIPAPSRPSCTAAITVSRTATRA